jgi:hypothetical protein
MQSVLYQPCRLRARSLAHPLYVNEMTLRLEFVVEAATVNVVAVEVS